MTRPKDTISNCDVAVYILGQLGGALKAVHTEHIAVEAHRLAPDRFSWRLPEYREKGWPDKAALRHGLEDAAREKYGALVKGTSGADPSKDGWRLTANGINWLEKNAQRIAEALGDQRPTELKMPAREAARFSKQYRSAPLFRLFRAGRLGEATIYQFVDILNCSPDAPRDVIASQFERLRAMSQYAGDDEISALLEACAERFEAVLAASREHSEGRP